MALKANPAATGVLVAGIVLAPAALVASVAPAPVDPAALVVPAPVVSAALVRAALVRAALVRAAPAHRVDLAATVALGRRAGPAAMAAPASLGIPRADPVATDRVAARVVRISVLSR
jgi:hypothetical protein